MLEKLATLVALRRALESRLHWGHPRHKILALGVAGSLPISCWSTVVVVVVIKELLLQFAAPVVT